MSRAIFAALFERYVTAVTAGDLEAIVAIYSPAAKLQIPVGGPVHEGIEAIRAFYRDNELAQSLAVAGPACRPVGVTDRGAARRLRESRLPRNSRMNPIFSNRRRISDD